MPCFTPLKAYRAPGGKIAFNSKAGYGDLPLEIPCGQCVGCRAEKSRQWALRCVHEAQMHKANSFVTLTYDDKHLPPDGGLVYEDFRNFCRRLRRRCGAFRFFHCGEYGENFGRPHYHALVFGLDFASDRILLKDRGDDSLYVSPTLTEVWENGHASLGACTYASAFYVAQYCTKKLTGERKAEYGGRRPPYATMSRRPGIGSTWFDKFMDDVYPSDEVVHDGKRFRPPRFYDEALAGKSPAGELLLSDLKAGRAAKARSRSDELSPARLRVRERIAEARLSRFRRSL